MIKNLNKELGDKKRVKKRKYSEIKVKEEVDVDEPKKKKPMTAKEFVKRKEEFDKLEYERKKKFVDTHVKYIIKNFECRKERRRLLFN